MTRLPNVNVGKSLTVHAKTPEEEEKIRAFKELHSRNPDLTIHDTIMECVRQFLAKHNYPPGNSQTVLTAFVGQPVEKCFRCGNTFHSLIKVQFVSGLRAGLCRKCFEMEKAKGPYCTIKKVLGG
ncbi:hypothetical protein KEJ37_00375 [Candidatus Bathyarchaeota archaeon]|nr:hypothetical protein [Candidatus Bathyarchaeota archaeon]